MPIHGARRGAADSYLHIAFPRFVAGLIGSRLPGGFVPDEDQGYFYVNAQLPLAASLDRTASVNDKLDAIFKTTPGIKYYTGVAGFSLLSLVTTTYNSFYFITLDDWDARDKRWYYTDGRHWYWHNGKTWDLYRFDKAFGRENFERGGYVVPAPGVEVVVPTHGVFVGPR